MASMRGGSAGLVVACALCTLAAHVAAQPAPPLLTAPVNDFAGIIDDASEREMDRRIRALQAASGDVVVVATVKTFQPYADINEYKVKMFENGGRGVGDRGKENGLLLVVAIDDRQVGIEVGYALEAFITDGFAGETIRDVIRPQFQRGAFGPGLLAGTTHVINRIAERRGVTLEGVPRAQPAARPRGVSIPFPVIVIVWLLLLSLGRLGRRRRRRRWGRGPWSGWNSGVGPFGGGGFGGGSFGGGFGGFGGGGGGGGGFGGFGGGRSGGGGASGGW
jgi:uncharacterized protein